MRAANACRHVCGVVRFAFLREKKQQAAFNDSILPSEHFQSEHALTGSSNVVRAYEERAEYTYTVNDKSRVSQTIRTGAVRPLPDIALYVAKRKACAALFWVRFVSVKAYLSGYAFTEVHRASAARVRRKDKLNPLGRPTIRFYL